MGALTSNRKRGDDYYNSIPKSSSFCAPDIDLRVDTRISKKPKFSPSMHPSPDRSCLLKNAASRISQYPKPIPWNRRDVHAPCRATKFGFSTSSRLNTSQREGSADVIGYFLGNRYEEAKIRAFDEFRYWNLKKDKDVIDVEAETVKDEVSEDSGMEEVAVVHDTREGRSVDSDQRSRETNEILETYMELDAMAAERNFQPSSSSLVSNLTNANLKLGGEGDLLYLNRELDVLNLDVPLHKKLLDSAETRNDKLSSLRFQIELHESSIATLKLYRPAKKSEDLVKEAFVPLTKDEVAEVALVLSRPKRRVMLVAHKNSNIEVTGEILQCLRPRAWLNDEVINLYFELLKEREKREPQKFLKCHYFNTFFYKKLINGRSGYDFKSVKRWTTQRKLGYCLIECDKIFVPIHKEVHWCLAVINKKDEKFQYLDSLRGVDKQVMKVLARYFVDEVKDKSGIDIDVSSWKQEYVEDLPDQENGFDCGMFMIKYADFYSRDVGLCFNQEHMPYFRLRTVKEILRLKAE